MVFRLNEGRCWLVALLAMIVSMLVSIWPLGEVKSQFFVLLAGALSVYLVLVGYVAARLICWIDSKGLGFGRTICVFATFAFLLAMSWGVFGGYFILSASQGLQSTEQLAIDYLLRKGLKIQKLLMITLPVLSVVSKKMVDSVGSILVLVIGMALLLG